MDLQDYSKQFEVEKFTDSFKEVIKAKSFPTKQMWLRVVPLSLIIIGIILGFVSLYIGTIATRGFGLNSVVVNPPNTTQLNYKAYENVTYQIWTLRAAPGIAKDAPLPGIITLALPNPQNVPEGGLIQVKNMSIKIDDGTLNHLDWAAAANVKTVTYDGNDVDTISPNTYVSYVSATHPTLNVKVWFRNSLP